MHHVYGITEPATNKARSEHIKHQNDCGMVIGCSWMFLVLYPHRDRILPDPTTDVESARASVGTGHRDDGGF